MVLHESLLPALSPPCRAPAKIGSLVLAQPGGVASATVLKLTCPHLPRRALSVQAKAHHLLSHRSLSLSLACFQPTSFFPLATPPPPLLPHTILQQTTHLRSQRPIFYLRLFLCAPSPNSTTALDGKKKNPTFISTAYNHQPLPALPPTPVAMAISIDELDALVRAFYEGRGEQVGLT